jgi:hypothetical protein
MGVTLGLFNTGIGEQSLLVEITQKHSNQKYRKTFERPVYVPYYVQKCDEIRILIEKNKPNMFLYESKILVSAWNTF